jgi:hypothetical protein
VQGQERHREIEALARERQALLVSENAAGLRHGRQADHGLGAPAPAQHLSGDRGRRAHVERKGKSAQHRGEPLLQILDGADQEKIGITFTQRTDQPAADEGAVEDEGHAHEALDMACTGARTKDFFRTTHLSPRRPQAGKGIH